MVSRENAVILGFGVAALVVGYGGRWLTGISTDILIATILFVGVVAPMLVTEYLDRKRET